MRGPASTRWASRRLRSIGLPRTGTGDGPYEPELRGGTDSWWKGITSTPSNPGRSRILSSYRATGPHGSTNSPGAGPIQPRSRWTRSDDARRSVRPPIPLDSSSPSAPAPTPGAPIDDRQVAHLLARAFAAPIAATAGAAWQIGRAHV